ncbi:MAG: pectate lyase [Saprospiraceae bacterium]|nr:pectate lyase [Saprospiraceae bacterium]
MNFVYPVLMLLSLTFCLPRLSAQDGDPDAYLTKRWQTVATRMPADWYGSDAAKSVAENVLLTQKEIGGWAKNKPYHHKFSEGEKAEYLESKGESGATFDNGATITELRFLAKVYAHFKDERYKQAFEKGLAYIFEAQYENGGWPQFYPVRAGESVAYSGHITYNDNAMANIMRFLEEIAADDAEFAAFQLNADTKAKAKQAFDKGIQCFLDTQIIVDGKPTVWCAQHDAKTLAPAKARKYELPSFSGAESVGIVLLLMDVDQPSEAIVSAVDGAIRWFENHKITGIRQDVETTAEGKRNKIIVEDKDAPPVWARFYDLETGKPFFCDRDGIKKNTMAEIGFERRNGYGWYTDAPEKLLKEYPKWRKRIQKNASLQPVSSGVYKWADHPVKTGELRESRKILEGSSPHFEYLEMHATTQFPGAKPSTAHANDDIEECIIVQEGTMKITIEDSSVILGPRGVILLMPEQMHSLENIGDTKLTYFVMRYRSKKKMDTERGQASGGSLTLNADALTFKPSSRGGGIAYFDRSTAMCERFEMHITQLDKKGPSHQPHAHAETEIILVLSGNTEMTIDGKEYTAGPGDFYFMNSESLHGVRNASDAPCSYFAFKWK